MQNNIDCKDNIFCSHVWKKHTQNVLPLLNLLDILTINNINELQALKFVHNWHNQKLLPIFNKSFLYVKEVQSYNTKHASKNNYFI